MRRVISLWLPLFATERARPPSSAEAAHQHARPRVLVRGEGGRQTLHAVDAAAQAAGLRPGLPLPEARAQVPDLASAPADPDGDARALRRLAAWCGRYSPWTAPDDAHDANGAAGVLIDATGCAHLFGGEDAMLADLHARLARQGLSARAAVAATPGAAWALARFATDAAAPTRVVPDGAVRAALSPLPPAALRLGAAERDLLHRLGLRQVGDLYNLPPAALAPRVGPEVARRLDRALGRRAEPIDPLVPRPALYVRRAFAEPIGRREDLWAGIAALIDDLCQRLADAGQGARRLGLTLYRVDGGTQPVRLGTSRASRTAAHLRRLFAQHLDQLDAGFGVEAMTLAALSVEALGARQLGLQAEAAETGGVSAKGAADLTTLVDRLTNRFGDGAVTRPRPAGSHLPEAAVRAAPPLDKDAAAWPATPPRPIRLLATPQPIEATALLPDHPPAQFRWRKLIHRVVQVEGPERLTPEWWRATPDDAVAPDDALALDDALAPRDLYRVETPEGRRYWLAHQNRDWWLWGVFG
jgi:protein ImuB